MPLPSTRQIRKPLLEIISSEAPQNFSINNFLELIAEHFGENLDEMSSGDKTNLKTAINDAKSYLKLHGLISTPSKQTYMITKAGSEVLGLDPEIIDDEFLRSLSETPSLDDEISAPVEPEEPEPLPEPEEPELPEPELEELPELPEEPEKPEESPEPFNEPEDPEPEPDPDPDPEEPDEDITRSEPDDYEPQD
ncbi:MAG: winged helix-turn-helix domain-containing protein, partial [Synergistaceae bacterium]|nr:winged helix-turn-helix domain-containing protein [Synergistaceae bacterium]